MNGREKLDGKRKNRLIITAALLLCLTAWIVWDNLRLVTSFYDVSSDNIPAGFDGFTIVQISDLHNAQLGTGNSRLLAAVKAAKPDIIVITGDFADSRNTDIGVSEAFASETIKIAPCYYVTGNHEARLGNDYITLENSLLSIGVTVLRNQTVELEREGDCIELIGIDDPTFSYDESEHSSFAQIIAREIEKSAAGADYYRILLSHHPETLEVYASENIGLALCGHAHGGQFRLPFIGGVIAPDQGLFPEYDAGAFKSGETDMIISRGLGNSIIPLRLNNPPELVVVTLHSGSGE